MSHTGYNCGGKGRYGNPPKECTKCGRHHPKGKKQREKAIALGWTPCKQVAANKASSRDHSPFQTTNSISTPERTSKMASRRERNLARKAKRRKEAEERNNKWASLSLAARLESLSERPGKCEKQIQKLIGIKEK